MVNWISPSLAFLLFVGAYVRNIYILEEPGVFLLFILQSLPGRPLYWYSVIQAPRHAPRFLDGIFMKAPVLRPHNFFNILAKLRHLILAADVVRYVLQSHDGVEVQLCAIDADESLESPHESWIAIVPVSLDEQLGFLD